MDSWYGLIEIGWRGIRLLTWEWNLLRFVVCSLFSRWFSTALPFNKSWNHSCVGHRCSTIRWRQQFGGNIWKLEHSSPPPFETPTSFSVCVANFRHQKRHLHPCDAFASSFHLPLHHQIRLLHACLKPCTTTTILSVPYAVCGKGCITTTFLIGLFVLQLGGLHQTVVRRAKRTSGL